MKSKLLIIIFLASGMCYGQVPNTTTFSLTDVTAVVGGTSLTAAFANSVDANFDPAYKGSKNSLLNFRNYGSGECFRPTGLVTKKLIWGKLCGGVTTYFHDVTPYNGTGGACSALYDLATATCGDVGFNAQAANYNVGATVYFGESTNCTKPADGYYIIEFDNTGREIYHIASGIITEKLYCYF